MAKPWYPKYTGDYLRKTKHLSLVHHGAYGLMLDWYYANRKPLPNDVSEIYRICGAVTPVEQQATDRVLKDFFKLREDGYHNDRADQEIIASDRASAHGKAAADARWMPGECPSDAQGIPPQPLSQPQPETTITPATAGGAGTAVPACPHREIIEAYHRLLPCGTQVKLSLWQGHRAQALVTRWREDKSRQSVAWWEGFFSHCAKSKFLTGKVDKPGRDPFVVSLDWLLKPANMVKVLEGYYNR